VLLFKKEDKRDKTKYDLQNGIIQINSLFLVPHYVGELLEKLK